MLEKALFVNKLLLDGCEKLLSEDVLVPCWWCPDRLLDFLGCPEAFFTTIETLSLKFLNGLFEWLI